MAIDVNQGASMWAQGAGSQLASQKYQQKTANKGNLQKERSLAAEPTYAARVTEAVQSGARAAAVSRQDPTKYERAIASKGVQNRVAGINAAGPQAWANGFSPFAPVIDNVRAGFGPKSSDVLQNVTQRTGAIAVALRNAKKGGVGGYGGGGAGRATGTYGVGYR